MDSFTFEEKIRLVEQYKKDKKNIKFDRPIRDLKKKIYRWSKIYDLLGPDGLKRTIKDITEEEKNQAIQRYLNGEGKLNISFSLGLSSCSYINYWLKTYRKIGIKFESMKTKANKQYIENITKDQPTESKKFASQAEELEYLRAENLYLKKLQALILKRKQQHKKK